MYTSVANTYIDLNEVILEKEPLNDICFTLLLKTVETLVSVALGFHPFFFGNPSFVIEVYKNTCAGPSSSAFFSSHVTIRQAQSNTYPKDNVFELISLHTIYFCSCFLNSINF